MKRSIAILASCALIHSCAEKVEIDYAAEADALMETSRAWAQSKTNDEYLSYWTEDAVVMPEGQASCGGHGEIMEMLKSSEGIPGFEVTWEPYKAKISKDGHMGYLLEKIRFKMNDSLGNLSENYFRTVTIWEKQEDGSWKCVVDIYNNDPSLTSLD